MSTGALLIVALRLVVPLAIPRWPLVGGLASMLVDALDVVLIEVIDLGGFGDSYHTTDKLLDSWYLAIEFLVALHWENAWARWPAVLLFPYRLIGVALFELTGQRVVLFIFPNLFENWWLYAVAVTRFAPQWAPRDWATMLAPLLLRPEDGAGVSAALCRSTALGLDEAPLVRRPRLDLAREKLSNRRMGGCVRSLSEPWCRWTV